MYTLPDDAPEKLVSLLERWQRISNQHPPTQHDLAFDDFVDEHPGLILVEPVWRGNDLLDLKYVQVGPEHDARNRKPLKGLLYSEALHARVLGRHVRAYGEVFTTGEPHYWEITNTVYGAPPQQWVRLLLPLYDEAGNAVMFLGSCVWKD